MKLTAPESAKAIKDTAEAKGFQLEVSATVLTVKKGFTPNNQTEYVQAEGYAYTILSHLPQSTAGSVWGTTSDGVGGYVGCKNGLMTLNKSGGSKRVLKALAKLLKP